MTPEHTALVARLEGELMGPLHRQAAVAICALAGEVEELVSENDACDKRIICLEAERDTLRAEVAALRKDAERYRWLANRVLACDYGDNDATGEQVGWRIRHDLLAKGNERQPAFMYGTSIDKAIDAAQADKQEES